MARLVTLAQAKRHLRIEGDDQNADIDLKVLQASGTILSYLKDRRTTIASISAANPAVVTTSVPHSLTSGTTYTINGTTTTPTVNGAQIVTVLTPTTFTVPVNVTSGQSAAAGTIGSAAWTDTNVPPDVQAATLLMLTHLMENRGDDMSADAELWEAIANLCRRQRDPALA